MTALLVSLAIGGSLVLVGFGIGRAYERQRPVAQVADLPRHPAHHHRTSSMRRTAHGVQRPSLRLVSPIFDFETQSEEPTPA